MTSPIPAKLKAADITRFALRAAQLEKAKPVIAYYCNYWIVNQILLKGLHNADSECVTYTTNLMDKLEQFKAENQNNDAVTDDLAGRVYVEQFGLETFDRAGNAMQANKASRQTADTFQAAATFLELLQIWGEVDPENSSKIKYAKYHALRIAKAVKAGEDPNLSNPAPKPEPAEAEILPTLDPNDAEVQELNGGAAATRTRQPSVVEIPDEAENSQRRLAQRSLLDESLHPSRASSVPRPPNAAPWPKVEEVPDEAHKMQRKMARQSSLDESLHPSRAPSLPRPANGNVSPPTHNDLASFYTSSEPHPDVSPVASSSSGERKESIGGNYFPMAPGNHDRARMELPAPPADFASQLEFPDTPTDVSLPSAPSNFPSLVNRDDSQSQSQAPPPPVQHHGHFLPPTASIPPSLLPHSQPRQQIPQAPPQLRPSQHDPPLQRPAGSLYTHQVPPPPQLQPSVPEQVVNVVVDEEAITKAQKHARWAISALNFEDVPTAIKELRGALETLGAKW